RPGDDLVSRPARAGHDHRRTKGSRVRDLHGDRRAEPDGVRSALSAVDAARRPGSALSGRPAASDGERARLRRQVVARSGDASRQTTDNIDINIDIDLDKDLTVRLANPPNQVPGPTLDAVFPFVNLKSEGVIGLNPTAVFSNEVTLHNMPSIAASDFFYMGGS